MSSTGQQKVVRVSDWGLQMTLGSGPQSRLSLWKVKSGLLAQATGLGLANHIYLLI